MSLKHGGSGEKGRDHASLPPKKLLTMGQNRWLGMEKQGQRTQNTTLAPPLASPHLIRGEVKLHSGFVRPCLDEKSYCVSRSECEQSKITQGRLITVTTMFRRHVSTWELITYGNTTSGWSLPHSHCHNAAQGSFRVFVA
ncbi:uncharacterized [Tachysurus ichikawai]